MAFNSTSVMKIIDLVSEGPIHGLVRGRESIFFDETSINNYDNKDINFNFQLGTADQDRITEAFGGGETVSTVRDIRQEIGTNYYETLLPDNRIELRHYGAGSIYETITDSDATSFEVLFSIPRLFSTAMEGLARGQLFAARVTVKIFVAANNEGFNLKYEHSKNGISTSDYQFMSDKIELSGEAPWRIKIEKVTNAEEDYEIKYYNFEDLDFGTPMQQGRANTIFATALTEHQDSRNRYPYTACVGLSIATSQFSSLPTRAFELKGIKVLIPNNAYVRDDGSLTFQGSFDGTLKGPEWTTCPVCAFYDMLINNRYGADLDADNISWVDLYPLCQYANQLVASPEGDEPRFALNTILGAKADAYSVLQDLASTFRGMTYWASNTVQVTADHGNLDQSVVSPVHLYTNSNVIGGNFEYSGTSLKTRNTSIVVRYNDPENFYKSNFIVVENYDLIDKYGYQPSTMIAFGCTSKYQAQRLGRWKMAAEELDGKVVIFSTGLDGLAVMPGQVFAVADTVRQGTRLSGRVASASTTAITLDQVVPIPSGSSTQYLTCVMADGDVETKTISSVNASEVTVSSAFSAAPKAQSVWSISADTVSEQKFRCIQVVDNNDATFTVTGVEFNDSIYNTADTGSKLVFEDITTFDEAPAKPLNLTLRSTYIRANNALVNRVIAEWQRGLNGNTISFETRYRVGAGNYTVNNTTNTIWDIDFLPPHAVLRFEVRAVGPAPIYKKSAWVVADLTIPPPPVEDPPDEDEPPQVEPPPDPINVTLEAISGEEVILRWEIPRVGIERSTLKSVIRHAPETDGTGTWAGSVMLTEVAAITQYALLNLVEGEYLVKFEDTNTGLRSENAVSATIDLPEPIPKYTVQTRREDTDSPQFQGQREDIYLSTTSGMQGLVLDGTLTIDEIGDFDELVRIDFTGNRKESGTYIFNNPYDLGGVYSIELINHLKSVGVYPADLFDLRTEKIDRWGDFDGLIADDVSSKLYFRASDNPVTDDEYLLETGDTILLETGDKLMLEDNILYGPWIPFDSGRYKGRLFQFRCDLISNHVDQTPVVSQMGYTMKMVSRTEKSENIASGASAKSVTFTNAFYQTPNVGLTTANLSSGDYYELTNVTTSGFQVHFKNSSNASVDRNFTYQAVGFGKKEN